jgi:hypothetical protein
MCKFKSETRYVERFYIQSSFAKNFSNTTQNNLNIS